MTGGRDHYLAVVSLQASDGQRWPHYKLSSVRSYPRSMLVRRWQTLAPAQGNIRL